MLIWGGEDILDDVSYVYTSAKEGYATTDPATPTSDMRPLLDLMVDALPGPEVDADAPLQMMVTTLDWSEYVGRIAVGRINAGTISANQTIDLHQSSGVKKQKISALFVFDNLGRAAAETAEAGDIVAIEGLADVEIGDTIGAVDADNALPRLKVDEPTLEMVFSVNSSPMVGREGKYVTTRQLKARLEKELERNVALRVEMVEGTEAYAVKGRGVLHLAILIETMRREGFELSVGKPRVIFKTIDGKKHEPFETLRVEVPTESMGPVMELVGNRRGQLDEMSQRGDYSLLSFTIPSRGLIGLRTRLLNATRGTAIINHRFESYRPFEGDLPSRSNGVFVSMVSGKSVPFAMFNLQDRGEFLIPPGVEVYEGMIVGESARDKDVTVNPCREKKLTNMRASGSDENVIPETPTRHVAGGCSGVRRGRRIGGSYPRKHSTAENTSQGVRPPTSGANRFGVKISDRFRANQTYGNAYHRASFGHSFLRTGSSHALVSLFCPSVRIGRLSSRFHGMWRDECSRITCRCGA